MFFSLIKSNVSLRFFHSCQKLLTKHLWVCVTNVRRMHNNYCVSDDIETNSSTTKVAENMSEVIIKVMNCL